MFDYRGTIARSLSKPHLKSGVASNPIPCELWMRRWHIGDRDEGDPSRINDSDLPRVCKICLAISLLESDSSVNAIYLDALTYAGNLENR
jgi:hypothetical protein